VGRTELVDRLGHARPSRPGSTAQAIAWLAVSATGERQIHTQPMQFATVGEGMGLTAAELGAPSGFFGTVVRVAAPSFVLLELPGAHLVPGNPPHGDPGVRRVLGPDLVRFTQPADPP
jgi:hypothetical protein